MRRAAKVDRNHDEVVRVLRSFGASVHSLAAVGAGVPDLLVGYQGRTILIEVKDGTLPPSARALTPDQLTWHARWNGEPVLIITDAADVWDLLRTARPQPSEC